MSHGSLLPCFLLRTQFSTSAIGLSKPRSDQLAPPSFPLLQHYESVCTHISGIFLTCITPQPLFVLLTALVNTHICVCVSVFSTGTRVGVLSESSVNVWESEWINARLPLGPGRGSPFRTRFGHLSPKIDQPLVPERRSYRVCL